MPTTDTSTGVCVYYEKQGEGPPLILLSGTGHDHNFWNRYLPFFTARFTVLTLDNRDVGRTPPWLVVRDSVLVATFRVWSQTLQRKKF